MNEREQRAFQPTPRLPVDAVEQVAELPPFAEREVIARGFHAEIIKLLGEKEDAHILDSAFRAKADAAIQLRMRAWLQSPLLDIYGVRLFVPDSRAADNALHYITDHYNDTPLQFPSGVYSIRDYSDPRHKNRKVNPITSDDYEAIHVNCLFGEGKLWNIGEVQIFTPEQWTRAEASRLAYEARRDASRQERARARN